MSVKCPFCGGEQAEICCPGCTESFAIDLVGADDLCPSCGEELGLVLVDSDCPPARLKDLRP